jgi:hypothetical protein
MIVGSEVHCTAGRALWDAVNAVGGMGAWEAAGFPVVS